MGGVMQPTLRGPGHAAALPAIVNRRPPEMTPQAFRIACEVAGRHGVTLMLMRGENRNPRAVRARWEAWWRVRQELGHSYPRIGRAFNRDHSTVMYGVNRYEENMRKAASA